MAFGRHLHFLIILLDFIHLWITLPLKTNNERARRRIEAFVLYFLLAAYRTDTVARRNPFPHSDICSRGPGWSGCKSRRAGKGFPRTGSPADLEQSKPLFYIRLFSLLVRLGLEPTANMACWLLVLHIDCTRYQGPGCTFDGRGALLLVGVLILAAAADATHTLPRVDATARPLLPHITGGARRAHPQLQLQPCNRTRCIVTQRQHSWRRGVQCRAVPRAVFVSIRRSIIAKTILPGVDDSRARIPER